MNSTRRRLIRHAACAVAVVTGSIFFLGTTTGVSADTGQKWKDVVPWNHSWDAADAMTYADDGESFDIPPAVRVDLVPDPNGDLPLSRDKFGLLSAFTYPPFPGTLYQSSNSMFGGRPSWFSDVIVPHNPQKPSYFYSLQSTLTVVQRPKDEPLKLLEWSQPWWGAVLVRGVGPFEGHNQAYIDGNPGMVTISRSKRGTVMVRSWIDGQTLGGKIDSGAPYEENTALVMWLKNGSESFLEVNYRGADGFLVTKRVLGTIGGTNMNDFHSGLSHTNYTSSIGIAKGIPTTAQTDAVRNWAAPYIPDAK